MLATRLQCPFYEGDDYHPQANRGRLSKLQALHGTFCLQNYLTYFSFLHADKMHSGVPLQDSDRWPWLQTLANIIHQHIVRYMLYHHVAHCPVTRCAVHQQTSCAVCRDKLAVVACSALKQRYRDILSGRDEGSEHVKEVAFVSTS